MRFISASIVALFVVFLGGMVSPVFAEPRIHQSTSSPSDARFEIVQSPLSAKWTFRLNRYTGQVYQLAETPRGRLAWIGMIAIPFPQLSSKHKQKPSFVIFSSGLTVRDTFLLDSETGRTWVLRSSPSDSGLSVWQSFKE